MNEESETAKKVCKVTDRPKDEYSQSLCRMVSEAYCGRGRCVTWFACIVGIACFAIAVYAVVQAFGAETRQSKAVWVAAFSLSAAALMLVKIWFWMLMFHNNTLRAIRRLEQKLDDVLGRCEEK